MLAQDGIIVVTRETTTADAVRSALDSGGQGSTPNICSDLHEMMHFLEREPGRTVLVDIDPGPDDLLSDLDSVIGQFSSTRFVVLANEARKEWMLRAMQAGARHFIAKDEIEGDLSDALTRLRGPAASQNGVPGSVVTVLSAGGGCGATTLAINLATELAGLTTDPTLLVDLDEAYGGVAAHLGIKAGYGVADVLAADDRIDAVLIRSSAVSNTAPFSLLASPVTVDPVAPLPLQYDRMGRALQLAREAFPNIVIDAPRVPIDVAETLARGSGRTLIVFEMNVLDIRRTRSILDGLGRLGVPMDRVVPVANRFRAKKTPIRLAEVQQALGTTEVHCLSNDHQNVEASINFGKTLAATAPRSPIRREIKSLAASLCGTRSC